MTRFHLLAITALAATVVCGCGTVSERLSGPIDDKGYYAGVRFDAQGIREGHPLWPVLAVDIPFSAAADTVLLPYVAYEQAQAKSSLKR